MILHGFIKAVISMTTGYEPVWIYWWLTSVVVVRAVEGLSGMHREQVRYYKVFAMSGITSVLRIGKSLLLKESIPVDLKI